MKCPFCLLFFRLFSELLSLSLSSYVPPIFLGDPLLQYFKVLLVFGSTKSATDSRCGLTSARSWGIIVSLDLLVTSADTAQHVAAPHAVPLHGVTASTFTIADLCVSLFLQPVNKVLVNARPAFHTFDCSGSWLSIYLPWNELLLLFSL